MKNSDFNPTDVQIRDRLSQIYDELSESPGQLDDIPVPDLDLSFLDKPDKKERAPWRRVANIAAVFLVLLITSSAIAIWISSDAPSAVRDSTEKMMAELREDGIGSSSLNDDNDYTVTYETDTMDDIPYAREFLKGLYVPEYIPENYDLDSLVIKKHAYHKFTVEYNFMNGDQLLNILIFTIPDIGVAHIDNDEVFEYEGWQFGYSSNTVAEYHDLNFIDNDNVFIDILDNDFVLPREELIKIALSLTN